MNNSEGVETVDKPFAFGVRVCEYCGQQTPDWMAECLYCGAPAPGLEEILARLVGRDKSPQREDSENRNNNPQK